MKNDFYENARESFNNSIPEITEPPCAKCRYFTPRYRTDKKGAFDGLVLCSASEMHHDFSCFEWPTIEEKIYTEAELDDMWHAELFRLAKVKFNFFAGAMSKRDIIKAILKQQADA